MQLFLKKTWDKSSDIWLQCELLKSLADDQKLQ